MTGKDLIIYILENDLVYKEVFCDNIEYSSLFMTEREAAVKWKTGVATVETFIKLGTIKAFKFNDSYFILANEPNPITQK